MPKPITHNDVLRQRASTSTRATVDRIVRTYNLATDDQRAEGADWYADAESLGDVLTDISDYTREQIAACIAHLSPRTSWTRNVAGAWSLVTQGLPYPGILPANTRRARLALASDAPLDTLHGPKTSAFAANILGDRSRVTIDVWATRTALGTMDTRTTETTLRRVGVYAAIQHAFRVAATRLGVDPVTVQATVWIVERGRSSLADVDAEYAAMVDAYNATRTRQGLATI
jgi:hypothetical protein